MRARELLEVLRVAFIQEAIKDGDISIENPIVFPSEKGDWEFAVRLDYTHAPNDDETERCFNLINLIRSGICDAEPKDLDRLKVGLKSLIEDCEAHKKLILSDRKQRPRAR